MVKEQEIRTGDLNMHWEKELDVARQAALNAGSKLKSLFGNQLNVRKKGKIDLVTDADFQAENAILETIRRQFPNDSILSEESGEYKAAPERLWIVDPLDGTINFSHALPFYAVCIGLQVEGRMVMGIVFNPVMEELFEALEGAGALMNGKPVKVSKVSTLGESLVATGFPYSVYEKSGSIIQQLHQVLVRSQGVRRMGSAALDLCYLAAGRFDAYWEEGLKPWDTAAATVIVKEAGGVLTDYEGRPFSPYLQTMVASNGLFHDEMLEALKLEKQ
jgi:myo-inositol-1(or 4)-monophosphatase